MFKDKEVSYMGWSIITNGLIYSAYSSRYNELFSCDSLERLKAEIRKRETEYSSLRKIYGDLLR